MDVPWNATGIWLAGICLLTSACVEGEVSRLGADDAGPGRSSADASAGSDITSAVDAGADTRASTDTGADEGGPSDGGSDGVGGTDARLDSGGTLDTGTDSGIPSDTGVAVDAIVDGGGAGDTGTDVAPDAGPPPIPEDYQPCETASCWDTSILPAYCGSRAIHEDFSTGRYNVHRYESTLYEGTATQISLTRTGGAWSPVVIVADPAGEVLFDGLVGRVGPGFEVHPLDDGLSGTESSVEIIVEGDLDAQVFVTGWEVVDSDFADSLPVDATYRLEVSSICDGTRDLLAPPGAMAGELAVSEGEVALALGSGSAWSAPVRIDARASEHIGFRLNFSPSGAAADLQLLVWDGEEAVPLGLTNSGPGLRVLAGFDPFGDRTFWARARGGVSTGTLIVTRTVVEPGPRCTVDCGRLLQLPIPVDPEAQGFDLAPGNSFREQFGRRELLMGLFHAGFKVAAAGYGPFEVQDISNWDGSQPCCHQTHTGGYHADISLLTQAGNPVWSNPGSSFGDEPMALLLAGFFETGPYQTGTQAEIILDSGFHDDVEAGADALLARGEIDSATHALFDPGLGLIYHYLGHDNHIHVRVDR